MNLTEEPDDKTYLYFFGAAVDKKMNEIRSKKKQFKFSTQQLLGKGTFKIIIENTFNHFHTVYCENKKGKAH